MIINKLSDRTINSDLLKQLARTSNDEQPGIRTNTTICLGKIAKNLGTSSRSKVLIAAFSRSLRDPFVHARNAALMALAATSDCFTDEDSAGKVLPAVAPLLLDKEKLVRDQANKTLDIYLRQVRKAASQMPDSVLPPPQEGPNRSNSATPRMGTPQASEAASWAGWAISSFTNKLATAAGEIESTANAKPAPSVLSPPLEHRPAPIRASASASALARQAVASPPPYSTRTSTSSASASNAADFFQDSNGDAADEDFEAWGDMDDDDTAFKDAVEKPQPKAPTKTGNAANPFGNDDEEPDFAGWLASKGGKKPGAQPLPKGLAKPAASRPQAVARSSAPVRKVSSTVSVKPVTKKVEPAKETIDDDWGDGWD